MSPTEEDRLFFREHREFFGRRWKPKLGDFVLAFFVDSWQTGIVTLHYYEEGADDVAVCFWGRIQKTYERTALIWLPRQHQLEAMLEERGRFLMFNGPYAMQERRYQLTAMAEDLDRLDARIDAFGPTPAIALGKCLLELLKED